LVNIDANHNKSTTLHAHNGKKRFVSKNKVVEHIIKASIENATLIPPTHVLQPTFEGDKDDGIWMV